MARGDHRRTREDWSCSLCTLLNGWREKVCEACGHEREDESSQRSQSRESTPVKSEAARVPPTLNNGQRDRFMGVFFVSKSTTNEWMNEPRLRHNRKRPLTASREPEPSSRVPKQETKSEDFQQSPPRPSETSADYGGVVAAQMSEVRYVRSPSPDFGNDDHIPDAPTFNLLGYQSQPVQTQPEEREFPTHSIPDGGPSFSLLGSSTIDLTSAPETQGQRSHVEDKLAKAGLALGDSDSDDDATRVRRKLRRGDQEGRSSTGGMWDCMICTEPNQAHIQKCCLCGTARAEDTNDSRTTGYTAPSTMWDCTVCTEPNEEEETRCCICNTPRSRSATETERVSRDHDDNPRHFQEVSSRRPMDQEDGDGVQGMRECHICTHMNPAHSTRCNLCDIKLGDSEREGRVQSRGVADRGRDKVSTRNYDSSETEFDPQTYQVQDYGNFDADDFEEDTFVARRHDPQPSYRDEYIEDISDHETYTARSHDNQPPPKSRRSELHDFEHFRTVDDARMDNQCQIDYRSMFVASSSSRTYSDRQAKRRRESQKRKRSMQENASHGGKAAKPAKKAKATKASGKKAKSSPRRASTGREVPKKAKKARSTGAGNARRSSAPPYSNVGINHYDSTLGEIDEEVTTMAWEGVGSAGYF